METLIKWYFWLGIVGIGYKMLLISTSDYPRTESNSLGADLVGMFIGIFFAVWAWSLVYR